MSGAANRQPPIIILGAPRSGTLLRARILGCGSGVFLITEHATRLKARFCPEDQSGVNDRHLWWRSFDFEAWDTERRRPLCERPIHCPDKLAALRQHYLDMAEGRRLVIKNPQHVARVDFLKKMFPDARFVFSLRAPWQTIQSAAIKDNWSFVTPTAFVNALPQDLLLCSAATWAESIDVYQRERDEHWIVARHEELLAQPQQVVARLYRELALTDKDAEVRAATLPEAWPRLLANQVPDAGPSTPETDPRFD